MNPLLCRLRSVGAPGLAACAALCPSAAMAASHTQRYSYKVSVHKGGLVSGNTVSASVTVRSPDQRVTSWWSRSTVTKVVRKGVDGGYQQPYRSQGYRCAPVVKGKTTSFTCKLQGADVSTTITLRYAVQYRSH